MTLDTLKSWLGAALSVLVLLVIPGVSPAQEVSEEATLPELPRGVMSLTPTGSPIGDGVLDNPLVTGVVFTGKSKEGETDKRKFKVKGLDPLAGKFAIVVIDDDATVAESNEQNNVVVQQIDGKIENDAPGSVRRRIVNGGATIEKTPVSVQLSLQ